MRTFRLRTLRLRTLRLRPVRLRTAATIAAVLAAAILAPAAAAQGTDPASPPAVAAASGFRDGQIAGWVEGVPRHADETVVISDYSVELYNPDGTLREVRREDPSTGWFQFSDLQQAEYTLRTVPDAGTGYAANWWGWLTPDSPAAAITPGHELRAYVYPTAYFGDVLGTSAFAQDIDWMYESGLSTGYVDPVTGWRGYHPLESVTREAMAAFLYRYSGESFTPPSTPSFTDVGPSSTFFTAVEWMKARGIAAGNPDGSYGPSAPVSRQAMSAFLARYAHATPATPTYAPFTDVPVGAPFAAEIRWMYDSGLSTGYPDGSFHPGEAVSRQAMAAFLHRFDSTR